MRYISKEEHEIASRYLFVDLAIKTIEVDLERLEKHDLFKIKEVYITLLKKLLEIGIEERKELKKLLKKEDIQVVLTEKREDFTEYTFFVKGREEVKNYWNYHIRNRVRNVMNEWLEQTGKSHK